jgi:hypothetical protein
MLLAAGERRIGVARKLARLISDPRNPLFITHSVADILRARMLAIACGYEDADDLDHLRSDTVSSSPAVDCPIPAVISVPSRLCRAGKMRHSARGDPHDLRHGRCILRQLSPSARFRHAGYRRHR